MLEALSICNGCGVTDLSLLVPAYSSSSSSFGATTEVAAETSWLSGLTELNANVNPLTEFPIILCEELVSLRRLSLGNNEGSTLRLPAEMWWLPKECEIFFNDVPQSSGSKNVQVARGPLMTGGFVDVPAKFTGGAYCNIRDILAELKIENPCRGSVTKSASKR